LEFLIYSYSSSFIAMILFSTVHVAFIYNFLIFIEHTLADTGYDIQMFQSWATCRVFSSDLLT
jgi:hypothetical protein